MNALTLDTLRGFDPGARLQAGECRVWCPFCGERKPRDAGHRSLSVNLAAGLWVCHRCGAKGKLGERMEPGRPLPPADPPRPWRDRLQGLRPLAGTPGEHYLRRRGIECQLAHEAGVVYTRAWYANPEKGWPGRPAVLFPFADRAGRLVAAQGRCTDQREPGKLSAGPIGRGVFTTPGAWESRVVAITEAPTDALSLALAGLPAAALAGTEGKWWLPAACRGRLVLLALDADAAGDAGASKLAGALVGARCRRLRPDGAKDWNELLQRSGVEALRQFLAEEAKRSGER